MIGRSLDDDPCDHPFVVFDGGGFVCQNGRLCLETPRFEEGWHAVVVDLVSEKKRRGAAVVAIVHDDDVRAAIADTVIDVGRFAATA